MEELQGERRELLERKQNYESQMAEKQGKLEIAKKDKTQNEVLLKEKEGELRHTGWVWSWDNVLPW